MTGYSDRRVDPVDWQDAVFAQRQVPRFILAHSQTKRSKRDESGIALGEPSDECKYVRREPWFPGLVVQHLHFMHEKVLDLTIPILDLIAFDRLVGITRFRENRLNIRSPQACGSCAPVELAKDLDRGEPLDMVRNQCAFTAF